MLLLPALLVLSPVVAACDDEAFCTSEADSRQGGSCSRDDGESAKYHRWYNSTLTTDVARVHAVSEFACDNQQPVPHVSDHHEKMSTIVAIEAEGRHDEVYAWYSYGGAHYGCSYGVAADPDRIWILDVGRMGAGSSSTGCGFTNSMPSIVEMLP
jgi:hypothetical protein